MAADASGSQETARLQWSHVFSDMVRSMSGQTGGPPGPASMEPCLFRHGKALAEREEAQIAHELQWSHVFSDMVSRPVHRLAPGAFVLQWSHVFSDMVSATNSAISIHISLVLQWSHVFSDMVRSLSDWRLRGLGSCFNGAMSFQTW